MWLNRLTGISEESPESVKQNLSLKDGQIISKANGRQLHPGILEIPSLAELRYLTRSLREGDGEIKVSEVVANVQDLHSDPDNQNALFQVASQFNLLEMDSHNVTPEQGIGRYEYDPTQGPACAIACGAGTIYRNYFVQMGDQLGQTAERQLDCLRDLGALLGNENEQLWQMRNGYALPSTYGLRRINEILTDISDEGRDELKQALRVGLQWDTEVTLDGCIHSVSQAYCSALPVGYSQLPEEEWEGFARLVLEASYEATFHAALMNRKRYGNNTLYLTLLGGGAFGNRTQWIVESIDMVTSIFRNEDLDVRVVSYGNSNSAIQNILH